MRHLQTLLLLATFSISAYGQRLNFRTPGVPRTPDGKPNLSAPAPRTANGKPDLSGVWLHERISIAQLRQLFGPEADVRDRVNVPGMEADSVSKYALNILLDFKPQESPMRP